MPIYDLPARGTDGKLRRRRVNAPSLIAAIAGLQRKGYTIIRDLLESELGGLPDAVLRVLIDENPADQEPIVESSHSEIDPIAHMETSSDGGQAAGGPGPTIDFAMDKQPDPWAVPPRPTSAGTPDEPPENDTPAERGDTSSQAQTSVPHAPQGIPKPNMASEASHDLEQRKPEQKRKSRKVAMPAKGARAQEAKKKHDGNTDQGSSVHAHGFPPFLPVDRMDTKDIDEAFLSANDFSQAEDVIAAHASMEWPGDYSMQEHIIGQGREALHYLMNYVPPNMHPMVFKVIRIKAFIDWPMDLSMRWHVEQQQQEATFFLEAAWNTTDQKRIALLKKARSEWPDDFVMQYHVYGQQVQAGIDLGAISPEA